jgi:hypothetical protein
VPHVPKKRGRKKKVPVVEDNREAKDEEEKRAEKVLVEPTDAPRRERRAKAKEKKADGESTREKSASGRESKRSRSEKRAKENRNQNGSDSLLTEDTLILVERFCSTRAAIKAANKSEPPPVSERSSSEVKSKKKRKKKKKKQAKEKKTKKGAKVDPALLKIVTDLSRDVDKLHLSKSAPLVSSHEQRPTVFTLSKHPLRPRPGLSFLEQAPRAVKSAGKRANNASSVSSFHWTQHKLAHIFDFPEFVERCKLGEAKSRFLAGSLSVAAGRKRTSSFLSSSSRDKGKRRSRKPTGDAEGRGDEVRLPPKKRHRQVACCEPLSSQSDAVAGGSVPAASVVVVVEPTKKSGGAAASQGDVKRGGLMDVVSRLSNMMAASSAAGVAAAGKRKEPAAAPAAVAEGKKTGARKRKRTETKVAQENSQDDTPVAKELKAVSHLHVKVYVLTVLSDYLG